MNIFKRIIILTHKLRTITTQALLFHQYGDPKEVLQLETVNIKDEINPDEIKLKILSSAINPSDINIIEGTYPSKTTTPTFPIIPGNEAVAEVLEVGQEIKDLVRGDRVVSIETHQGTWRDFGIYKREKWHKIPNDISIQNAATLTINPPTALCMLNNFVKLKEGDVIVQNGATSAVGQAVIQICSLRNIKTFNIIRNRPNIKETSEYLSSIGATYVTTPEKALEDYKNFGLEESELGLNCIGGKEVSVLTKLLKKGGTLVTYGGMARKPMMVPASVLIFKDIHFRGFWWSGGQLTEKMGLNGKIEIINEIIKMIQDKKLNTRTISYDLSEFKYALEKNDEAHKLSKVIFKS